MSANGRQGAAAKKGAGVPSATALRWRRALMRGQLAQAEGITAELIAAASDLSQFPGARPEVMSLMLRGISSALAGNCRAAVADFEIVRTTPDLGPIISWLRLLWTARSCLGCADALTEALGAAQAAVTIARDLDDEARAVSCLTLAETLHLQGDHQAALDSLRSERILFSAALDLRERADAWLLEARVLMALGRDADAIAAARRAHAIRPSWPPPVTFIARCALGTGRLADIDAVIRPMLVKTPVIAEIGRLGRLLTMVRNRSVSTTAAHDFLVLQEGPPNSERIERMSALVEAHPKVDQFQEALGWMYLRVGDLVHAERTLTPLSERADLDDATRQSLMLAFGCLAAMRAGNADAPTKLWATVAAAPKRLQSSRPPPPRKDVAPALGKPSDPDIQSLFVSPSSGRIRVASPAETGGRALAGAPVFSGSLRVIALPDLLEFFRSGQKTGTLVCSSVQGIGAIQLRGGRITGAMAPRTRTLSEYLINDKIVTQEQVREALAEQEGSEPRPLLGTVLAKRGFAQPDQIKIILAMRVRDAIAELLKWSEGEFAFDPEVGTDVPSPPIDIELDAQGVLLDIFTRQDESMREAALW